MSDAMSFSELLLGRVDVPKQLQLFHHSLVLAHVHDHSRTVASLSKQQNSLRLTNLVDERRRFRPKLRNRLDILGEVNPSH